MLEKRYKDWAKVLKMDNFSFCLELKLSLLESEMFKEKVEVSEKKEIDVKKLYLFNELSDQINQKFKRRSY
jgi:hypothetical protein